MMHRSMIPSVLLGLLVLLSCLGRHQVQSSEIEWMLKVEDFSELDCTGDVENRVLFRTLGEHARNSYLPGRLRDPEDSKDF